jgi:type I restriction-modification system DNA methylase subunit
MNFDGFAIKGDKILAYILPCLFLSSMSNLLAEINAISIPAKKAENKIEQIIMRDVFSITASKKQKKCFSSYSANG